jgi:hypothetical protein
LPLLPTKYFSCAQIKENEIGGACNTHGREKAVQQGFGRKKPERRE